MHLLCIYQTHASGIQVIQQSCSRHMRTEASPVHYVVPGSHGDDLEDGDHRLDDVVQACRVLQDPRDCQGVLSCLKLLQSTGYLLRWVSSSKSPSPYDCCGAGSCLIFLSSIGCRYSQQQGHGSKGSLQYLRDHQEALGFREVPIQPSSN